MPIIHKERPVTPGLHYRFEITAAADFAHLKRLAGEGFDPQMEDISRASEDQANRTPRDLDVLRGSIPLSLDNPPALLRGGVDELRCVIAAAQKSLFRGLNASATRWDLTDSELLVSGDLGYATRLWGRYGNRQSELIKVPGARVIVTAAIDGPGHSNMIGVCPIPFPHVGLVPSHEQSDVGFAWSWLPNTDRESDSVSGGQLNLVVSSVVATLMRANGWRG